MPACPNKKSPQWRKIVEKTGSVFEAMRIFVANEYSVPDFVFKTTNDVYKYLDFQASKLNILSKDDGRYYIPYGKDLGTWYTNSNLVKNEVDRINKVYDGLLSVKKLDKKPDITKTPGRTKIEYVEVNEHALKMHYDVYNAAREKMDEESGEDILPIDTYEQRPSTEGEIASEKTIRDIAARMADRIGIEVKYISDRSQNFKGKLEGNTAVINLAYATLDTPIHEILGHPIIKTLKRGSEYNKQLYQNLLKELEYGRGKEVLDRIKKDYKYKINLNLGVGILNTVTGTRYEIIDINNRGLSEYASSRHEKNRGLKASYKTIEEAKSAIEEYSNNFKYTLEEQKEEALVELLGLYTADRLDKVKDGKLISLLKRLLKQMKEYMRSLFQQKEIDIDKLPDIITLGELADLLAYSNSKLIRPGHVVNYTTPDNRVFFTYKEASNHISNLIKSIDSIQLPNSLNFEFKGKAIASIESYSVDEPGIRDYGYLIFYKDGSKDYISERENEDDWFKADDLYGIYQFISKNKEYEQSKEIIEEWKRINNIKYDPEEVYSRGQGFYSAVGAYSDFDVDLMFQNLLTHIEDNKKAGGEFIVSAFTKPVDKKLNHIENKSSIRIKIFPKPEDIKWAANTDVYSGSVWDAGEKISKDVDSELLGVSYTKSPSLKNIKSVQPNLAYIIDNLKHVHNELGIELTNNNFRLEFDDTIPYSTKKIIRSINSILDERYGKIKEPSINKVQVFRKINDWRISEDKGKDGKSFWVLEYSFTNNLPLDPDFEVDFFPTEQEAREALDKLIKRGQTNIGKQPTQTYENLNRSIDSIEKNINTGKYYVYSDFFENPEIFNTKEEAWDFYYENVKEFSINKPVFVSAYETKYSQALINNRIAALKQANKKYPRSLIRGDVYELYSEREYKPTNISTIEDDTTLPFQLVPSEEVLYQRVGERIKEELGDFDPNKSKVETLREKVIEALELKHAIYSKRDFKHKEDLLKNTLERIKSIDNNPQEALRAFQEFAISQTDKIYKDYLAADRRNRLHNVPFSLRQLSKWKDYLAGFSLLSEFVNLMKDVDSDLEEGILDMERIQEALTNKNKVESAYFTEGTKLVANFLIPHSKHIEAEYREDIEKEYNTLPEESKALISKENYIKEQMELKADEIKEYTKRNIQRQLTEASKDINVLTRWLDNILDSPDVIISSLGKAVYDADFMSRTEYKELEYQMFDHVTALEDYYKRNGIKISEVKDAYKFMLEVDEKGNYTQNIVDVYRSSLWTAYEDYNRELAEKELTYDEIQEKLKKWRNDNMPIDSVSFNEAKNKFYDSLLERELITKKELKELKDNDDWRVVHKKDPADIVSSDYAAEQISEFFRDNIWKYRTPKNVWRNNQWFDLVEMAGGDIRKSVAEQRQAVKENKKGDPRVAFYNFILENRDRIQKGTPYGHRLHTRLPSVIKSPSERIESDDTSILNALKHSVNRELNVMADEDTRGERILTDEAGKPMHFIPIYYTASIRKIHESKYDKLSDEEKKKISKEDYVNKMSNEEQSYDLASIYSRYFQSAIDYKHKNNILPELEMARELVNSRNTLERDGKGNLIKNAINKYRDKVLTKAGVASNTAAQLNDWFEAIIYGIKEKDEGTLFGGKVDAAKAANTLNKFTALNMLGLNFVQGTANVLLGSVNQVVESAGKQFYSAKDLARANYIYGKNLPGILGDIGVRKNSNIISLLLDRFDVLNEYDKQEFRKDSRFKQLLSTNTLFFTSHAGEHFMQTKVLLAMLNKLQAVDDQGNEIGPMIDQFSVENGRLKINDKVKNFSLKDQADFEGKVRRVLSSIHGEYSEMGRVAAQRYALGRMAYMFRKFVIPGVKRRYGRKNVNNILGEYTEGYYRTMGRFMGLLARDMRNFQLTMFSENWNSLTDQEKANIRRAMIEMSFMLTATIMSSVLINIAEDDDDEDWLLSFLGYQSLRFKTEMWFFSNPSEAMKILRSPAASMSVIENFIKLLGQMLPPDFEGFERYERGNWKGRYKVNKTLINFVPGLKQVYRLKYIDDQISWLR